MSSRRAGVTPRVPLAGILLVLAALGPGLVVAAAGAGLVLAAAGPGAARPADAVEELLFELQMVPLDGQTPAPFTLETLSGQRISLADFRGKVVLVYFWATW
jgi:cytochrome oxidase Cu insertion factor (SCO1/SenC/PrrC family)